MTIRQFRIFIAVAEIQNMTKAAEQLYTTQSSISQVIIDIEKEYGVLLFERIKNSLSLTPAGKDMLKYAKKIVSDYDELENVLKHGSVNPRIRIGASVTVGSTVLRDIISELVENVNDVDYSAFVSNTHTIEDGILKNELDIGIVEGVVKSEDIIEDKITDDPMVLICSPKHHFYGKDLVTMKDIQGEPLIIREEGSGTRRQILERFQQLKLKPNIVWTCSSQEAVKNAVKENFGISVISKRVVYDEIESGALWACDIKDANLNRTFRIIYHKDKFLTNTMKEFIKLSEKHCNN